MIGIITAIDCEFAAVMSIMTNIEKKDFYTKGFIGGKEVAVVQSGMGKTGASIVTTRLLSVLPIEYIINLGVAGGLSEKENFLDVIIADKLTYHDMDTTAIDHYQKGFKEDPYVFYADEKLINQAKDIISKVIQQQCFIAPIVSGDQFIAGKEAVAQILKYYPESYAADMESCSIAHCCDYFKTPYLIIRSLSDIAVKDDNAGDYNTFKVEAARRAATFVLKLIENLVI